MKFLLKADCKYYGKSSTSHTAWEAIKKGDCINSIQDLINEIEYLEGITESVIFPVSVEMDDLGNVTETPISDRDIYQ